MHTNGGHHSSKPTGGVGGYKGLRANPPGTLYSKLFYFLFSNISFILHKKNILSWVIIFNLFNVRFIAINKSLNEKK